MCKVQPCKNVNNNLFKINSHKLNIRSVGEISATERGGLTIFSLNNYLCHLLMNNKMSNGNIEVLIHVYICIYAYLSVRSLWCYTKYL